MFYSIEWAQCFLLWVYHVTSTVMGPGAEEQLFNLDQISGHDWHAISKVLLHITCLLCTPLPQGLPLV